MITTRETCAIYLLRFSHPCKWTVALSYILSHCHHPIPAILTSLTCPLSDEAAREETAEMRRYMGHPLEKKKGNSMFT